MAKAKGGGSRALDEAGAWELIDDHLSTTDHDAYMQSQVPETPEREKILALKGPDQRVVIGVLAKRLGDLRRQLFAASAEKRNALKNPWVVGRGPAMSFLFERLLRRRHAFSPAEVVVLVSAIDNESAYIWEPYLNAVVGVIEHLEKATLLEPTVQQAVEELGGKLRRSRGAASVRHAERIERKLADSRGVALRAAARRPQSRLETLVLRRGELEDPSTPVMDELLAGMVVPEEANERESVRFVIGENSRVSARALAAVCYSLSGASATYGAWETAPESRELREGITREGDIGVATAVAAMSAMSQRPVKWDFDAPRSMRWHSGFRTLLIAVIDSLDELKSCNDGSLATICHALSRFRVPEFLYPEWVKIAEAVIRLARDRIDAMDDVTLLHLIRFRERLARTDAPEARAALQAMDRAWKIGNDFEIEIGERWSDRALTDLASMEEERRLAWGELIEHGRRAKEAKPSTKWGKEADAILARIPREEFEDHVGAWFMLVGKPRVALAGGKVVGRDSTVPTERNADVLRALALAASRIDSPGSARALGDLAMACFKMVPGVGARCIRPGTAALRGLAEMENRAALAQLSRLRQLVKFGTAKKMLEAALAKLAAQLGVSTSELHEMAAPDFGLDREGVLREEARDFTIEIVAGTGGADLRIADAAGKVRKSIPDSVKSEHADLLKSLRHTRDDIEKMLEAQRARIDAMFVDDRVWSVATWRERYITHPLVGVLGRRLIWRIVDDARKAEGGVAVLWRDSLRGFADVSGVIIEPKHTQSVRLWHPIHASAEEVRAWRAAIETSGVRQPVKQAHREVYPLTDAERATGTYSNRFAAHILKQHAFQQLAAERGWQSKLRLMVDAEYPPPTRELPAWALRAEFWIESVGSDYGRDTTESGSFLYVATDQVRFYRVNAAQASAHASGGGYSTYAPGNAENQPLPLEGVPPLVFSEMMRDVDLFVAGASVGNNAEWHDGGPDGRFRDYWHSYSFGELGGSGRARRELLQGLIPRLRIADVCDVEDSFLRVRGSLRTYLIHLGSGNILMEPNNQYLCIVPSSSQVSDGSIYLPFEGDRMLSIILSKAFMLADDAKIKDKSIVSQINRK